MTRFMTKSNVEIFEKSHFIVLAHHCPEKSNVICVYDLVMSILLHTPTKSMATKKTRHVIDNAFLSFLFFISKIKNGTTT